MKILINLVGLSHHDVGNGLHSFEKCYQSLFDKVVIPLEEKGHEVDFFLKTYETEKQNQIESIYEPVKSDFIQMSDKGAQGAFDTYLKSISELKEMDYDYYIVTRFDLWFGEQINLDFNKFSFLFKELDWWDNYKCTTDTFYGFPKTMLDRFVKACNDCRNKNGQPGYIGLFHALHLDLENYINENEFNFIDEEKQTVQISKKYTLSRYL